MERSNQNHQSSHFYIVSELRKSFTGPILLPWKKKRKATASTIIAILFIMSLLVFVGWIDSSSFSGFSSYQSLFIGSKSVKASKKQLFPLKCSTGNLSQTCPNDYPTKHYPDKPNDSSKITCPSFFRWIHEDLRPWKRAGISRDMIERASRTAHFRLVIVKGKAYVEKYRKSIQTRDMFTLWGILQLLRLYPGRLPDLELMFDCNDRPVVRSKDFQGPNACPPPLFRYCSNKLSLDIVFPDWSFWGWAETNIRPWRNILKEIKKGNKRIKWKDRVPYAYWKGNPAVAPTRKALMKCNVTDKNNWNTLLYIQDWVKESKHGYQQSNLQDQCTHRGMVPLQHYWPIRENKKCSSLKFAVEWGNLHPVKAQAIGEAAGKFMQEDLKMDNVYDYMFHLFNEYSKLLKFKPEIPPAAVELCSETIACSAKGTRKKFMVESMVMSPSDNIPCAMPPPYEPKELGEFLERKANSTRQVESWEDEYWSSNNSTDQRQ